MDSCEDAISINHAGEACFGWTVPLIFGQIIEQEAELVMGKAKMNRTNSFMQNR